jgi:hypothetical protein
MPLLLKVLMAFIKESGFMTLGRLPHISDKTLSMAFLELYPIVVAAVLWRKDWSGKIIFIPL